MDRRSAISWGGGGAGSRARGAGSAILWVALVLDQVLEGVVGERVGLLVRGWVS